MALIISGLMSFTGYWFSDKIVLVFPGPDRLTEKGFSFYTVAENMSLAARPIAEVICD